MIDENEEERLALRLRADQAELAERIARRLPQDGKSEVQPGLHLNRMASTGTAVYALMEPCLCLVAQGSKEILVGDECFRYDPARYLIATMQLPAVGRVVDASPERPYLSLRLVLDPAIVASVMVESDPGAARGDGGGVRAVDVSPLDAPLLDATLRLVRLAERPEDYRALAPLIVREIIYRLLKGEQGSRLRHLTHFGGQGHRMARAVEVLRRRFDEPLRIEDLAGQLNMSVSGFHAHFKAATTMTPLQFQKELRLQEARRLMLDEDKGAAEAGFQVGYDDASHFSRDYRRHFGEPPLRDVQRLRESPAAAP